MKKKKAYGYKPNLIILSKKEKTLYLKMIREIEKNWDLMEESPELNPKGS